VNEFQESPVYQRRRARLYEEKGDLAKDNSPQVRQLAGTIRNRFTSFMGGLFNKATIGITGMSNETAGTVDRRPLQRQHTDARNQRITESTFGWSQRIDEKDKQRSVGFDNREQLAQKQIDRSKQSLKSIPSHRPFLDDIGESSENLHTANEFDRHREEGDPMQLKYCFRPGGSLKSGSNKGNSHYIGRPPDNENENNHSTYNQQQFHATGQTKPVTSKGIILRKMKMVPRHVSNRAKGGLHQYSHDNQSGQSTNESSFKSDSEIAFEMTSAAPAILGNRNMQEIQANDEHTIGKSIGSLSQDRPKIQSKLTPAFLGNRGLQVAQVNDAHTIDKSIGSVSQFGPLIQSDLDMKHMIKAVAAARRTHLQPDSMPDTSSESDSDSKSDANDSWQSDVDDISTPVSQMRSVNSQPSQGYSKSIIIEKHGKEITDSSDVERSSRTVVFPKPVSQGGIIFKKMKKIPHHMGRDNSASSQVVSSGEQESTSVSHICSDKNTPEMIKDIRIFSSKEIVTPMDRRKTDHSDPGSSWLHDTAAVNTSTISNSPAKSPLRTQYLHKQKGQLKGVVNMVVGKHRFMLQGQENVHSEDTLSETSSIESNQSSPQRPRNDKIMPSAGHRQSQGVNSLGVRQAPLRSSAKELLERRRERRW
jgi:hypothetical protein